MEKLPEDLAGYFGPYDACFYDNICGEPVSWGYPVLRHVGDELWAKAQALGTMECDHGFAPKWFLVTKYLTPAEATRKYGEVTNIELGPRGGFRSVTYGTKLQSGGGGRLSLIFVDGSEQFADLLRICDRGVMFDCGRGESAT